MHGVIVKWARSTPFGRSLLRYAPSSFPCHLTNSSPINTARRKQKSVHRNVLRNSGKSEALDIHAPSELSSPHASEFGSELMRLYPRISKYFRSRQYYWFCTTSLYLVLCYGHCAPILGFVYFSASSRNLATNRVGKFPIRVLSPVLTHRSKKLCIEVKCSYRLCA